MLGDLLKEAMIEVALLNMRRANGPIPGRKQTGAGSSSPFVLSYVPPTRPPTDTIPLSLRQLLIMTNMSLHIEIQADHAQALINLIIGQTYTLTVTLRKKKCSIIIKERNYCGTSHLVFDKRFVISALCMILEKNRGGHEGDGGIESGGGGKWGRTQSPALRSVR